MENYNTLLIFGYGQTQLITDTDSKLVNSDELISLNAVIQDIYSKKPLENISQEDFTRIAIYNNDFADWINNNPNDYFKVNYNQLNLSLIGSLILEINSK